MGRSATHPVEERAIEPAIPLAAQSDISIAATPDAELLSRIAEGDRDALADLYAAHGTAILRYLRTLAGDDQLAEEVLQDTFLAIWRGASRFQGRASARTWCFGIARRRLRDSLRSRGHLVERLEEPLSEASLNAAAAEAGPETIALDRIELGRLVEAVKELSLLHREVLLLTFAEGLSGPEIAAILDVPSGTVKSRLSNARHALRAQLRTVEESSR